MNRDFTLVKWSSARLLFLLVPAVVFFRALPAAAWTADWVIRGGNRETSVPPVLNQHDSTTGGAIHDSLVGTAGGAARNWVMDTTGGASHDRLKVTGGGAMPVILDSADDGEIHGSHMVVDEAEVNGSCNSTRTGTVRAGANTADTANYLDALGWVSLQHHKYKEAESSFSRALELRIQSTGPEDTSTLELLLPLAVVLDGEGKYEQAEHLYRRAMPFLQRAVVRTRIEHDTSLLVKHLADTLVELEILPMALARRQTDEDPEHLAISTRLGICTLLQSAAQSYIDSNPQLAAKALSIQEEAQDPFDPDIVNCITNLAISYGTHTCHPYASNSQRESIYKSAVAKSERIYGSSDSRTVPALLNLAIFYCDEGDYNRADTICKQARAIGERESRPTAELIDTMDILCQIRRHQGRLNDTRELSDRALKLAGTVLESKPVEFGRLLLKRATLEASIENFQGAERYCDQAENIMRNALGCGHAETAWTMRIHARILRKQAAHPPLLVATNQLLLGCLPLKGLDTPFRSQLATAEDLMLASNRLAEQYKLIPPAASGTSDALFCLAINAARVMVIIGIVALALCLTSKIKRVGKTKLCSLGGGFLIALGLIMGYIACSGMPSALDGQPDEFYFQ